MNKIKIPLENGDKLIAEISTDPDLKEIYIGLEDSEGTYIQDLAAVCQDYTYDDNTEKIIQKPNRYNVFVWANSKEEDWTNYFEVERYQEQ